MHASNRHYSHVHQSSMNEAGASWTRNSKARRAAVLCKSLARDDRKFKSPTRRIFPFEKQNTLDDNRYRVNEMGKSCPVRGILDLRKWNLLVNFVSSNVQKQR